MANRIPEQPSIGRVTPSRDGGAIASSVNSIVQILVKLLGEMAYRLNRTVVTDGSEAMTQPLILATFTVATLPNVLTYDNGIIKVSDETGGETMAFSDGTNWRRVQDRAIVS